MLSIVTPGQGSQTSGMYSTWITDTANKELIAKYSELIDLDLFHYGTSASQVEITATNIAQPLLTALAFMSFGRLEVNSNTNIIYSGHSVGEFSAASLAGFYTDEIAMKLVNTRGKAMAAAAASNSATGMSAVLGGDKAEVIKHIEQFDLVPANVNSNGQIVASGLLANLEKLSENPPVSTKVRKLEVAGAFHSQFMKSAESELEKEFAQVEVTNSKSNFISNKDGQTIKDSSDLKNRLITQITSPVRWDLCQAKMIELGVTGMLELAPAGVLTGIAKREMPGVELFAIKSPEDIPGAQAFIDKHAKITR
ncbi:malonyl CoA-acyl carrier protein transacylase [Actinomycetes bacterium]|nr:malonyl CoA-acyl carrier protein transacylase [Actinomycetes bacterium]